MSWKRLRLAQGNLYMAHKCGFTEQVLRDTLLQSGFARVASLCRKKEFALYALAAKKPLEDAELKNLAALHM